MQIEQISSDVPSSCWAFSCSYQVTDVKTLTSSNNLRLSSQPSFSSLRSTDLQNNLGPSAQNKEQINMVKHFWIYCCLWISWATDQYSQKSCSSYSALAPTPWLAQTEMLCITALPTKENKRQQLVSLIRWNRTCIAMAPVSLKPHHHYPTSPKKIYAC